jgi:co-chaperonin GroES (HSP10)
MALLAEMRVVHDKDPRQEIFADVGPLEAIEVLNQYVLIGIYVRKAGMKTPGGIELPQAAVDDDQYQTKVGLVLKLGPRAFQDDENVKFYGFKPKIGDWVAFRASEGTFPFQIYRHKCRLIADVHIKLRLKHPDAIY